MERKQGKLRHISRRLWGGVALLLWGGFGGFAEADAQVQPTMELAATQSRYQRTVSFLQEASPDLRTAFAVIALTWLGEAYEEEAKLARSEARLSEGKRGLLGWSVAVQSYARQMPLLLDDIDLGFPVSLVRVDGATPAVSVADRVVILSHPRLNQQAAFEQKVLQDFCSRYRCEQYIAEQSRSDPIPIYRSSVQPAWSFTQLGPSCSYRGITVKFRSELNLANSRLICEKLMSEAVVLADEMSWQIRHAVVIDWNDLSTESTPDGAEHMVRLNKAGDIILVSVPLIHSTAGLLNELLPWLQGRLRGDVETQVQLDAEQFGWQNPQVQSR